MELMDVIRNRRAVRDYTNASIERAMIERLIEAAMLAPSAMNLQPWAFAVLLGRERIEGYAKRAKEWLLASLSQTSYDPSIRHMLEDPQFALFYHAPRACRSPVQVLGDVGCRRSLPRSRKPDAGCS
jgi:nitroreductase